MKTATSKYPSADGKTAIRALLWEPDAAEQPEGSETPERLRYSDVRGIVQVVHGMSEHVVRYAHFAKFLVESGFVVCANHHVGHGESVSDAQDLGHMPARDGAEVLVRDVHALRGIMQARFGSEVPYVMFGHSMGSFITRKYISEHGEGLAAAVLCGTGQQAAALSMAGNALANALARLRGERYKSGLLHSMADGAYSKAVKNPRTDFDWLSTDPAQVDAYINDSECGQMFTVGGYATLTALTGEVVRAESASKVPKVLPLLLSRVGKTLWAIAGAACGRPPKNTGMPACSRLRRKSMPACATRFSTSLVAHALWPMWKRGLQSKESDRRVRFIGRQFPFCGAMRRRACLWLRCEHAVSISSERMCAVGALLFVALLARERVTVRVTIASLARVVLRRLRLWRL